MARGDVTIEGKVQLAHPARGAETAQEGGKGIAFGGGQGGVTQAHGRHARRHARASP